MLLLEVTDGITTLKGMEYRPIKKFTVPILPGTKVIIFFFMCMIDNVQLYVRVISCNIAIVPLVNIFLNQIFQIYFAESEYPEFENPNPYIFFLNHFILSIDKYMNIYFFNYEYLFFNYEYLFFDYEYCEVVVEEVLYRI